MGGRKGRQAQRVKASGKEKAGYRLLVSPVPLACGLVAVVLAGLWARYTAWESNPAHNPPLPLPSDAAKVAALLQRAAAADPDGWKKAKQVPAPLKPAALAALQQVLSLSPTDHEANRAVGMDLLYKQKNEECLPHLKLALAQHPEDYSIAGWYAGATSRAAAKLPSSPRTQQLWQDAIASCAASNRRLAEDTGGSAQRSTSTQRFCLTHCCEIFQTLEQPDNEAACWRDGVLAGVWSTEGQRPVNYDSSLAARPWWSVEQLGRSTAHVQLIRTNWQKIAFEAKKILGAGQDMAGTAADRSVAASAAGFAMEQQGLHDQRSWHEFVLMSQGNRHSKNCQKAPYTCELLGSMPEISAAAIGDVKFSLMQPGTIVRPHTGPTNKRIRVHLGLDVPSGCCEITVGGEARAWADGELLIFDDSFEHSVAHTGTGERLILIADVLHPQLEDMPGKHYAPHGRQ